MSAGDEGPGAAGSGEAAATPPASGAPASSEAAPSEKTAADAKAAATGPDGATPDGKNTAAGTSEGTSAGATAGTTAPESAGFPASMKGVQYRDRIEGSKIEIGNSDLKNSPLIAKDVFYADSISINRAAVLEEEFELLEFRADDHHGVDYQPAADVASCRERLLSARLLLVLFESAQRADYKAFQRTLTRTLASADLSFKSVRAKPPFPFRHLELHASRYASQKAFVLMTPGGTISANTDLLEQCHLHGRLARHLTEINAYLLLPVSRDEAPDLFDQALRDGGDHVWVLPRMAAASQEDARPAPAVGGDFLTRAVQFVTAFLPGLGQREFDVAVERLARATEPPPPDRPARRAARQQDEPHGLEPMARWQHERDEVLEECGIRFVRGSGSPGWHEFEDPGWRQAVQQRFLDRDRRRVHAYWDALLAMMASDERLSTTFEREIVRLLEVLHRNEIEVVDVPWLVERHAAWWMHASATEDTSRRFGLLLQRLLQSASAGKPAQEFIEAQCRAHRELAQAWQSTVKELEALQIYASLPLPGDDALRGQVCQDVTAEVLAMMQHDQVRDRVPLARIWRHAALVVDTLDAVEPDVVLPWLIELAQQPPSPHPALRVDRLDELAPVFFLIRPASWKVYDALRGHFGRRPDALVGFGGAIARWIGTRRDELAAPQVYAITAIIDAWLRAFLDIAADCVDGGNPGHDRFMATAFAASRVEVTAAALAALCLLRSLPASEDDCLVPDTPRLRGRDPSTTAHLYVLVAGGLLRLAGSVKEELRRQVERIVVPLYVELGVRQRTEFRSFVRERKELYGRHRDAIRRNDRDSPAIAQLQLRIDACMLVGSVLL